MNSPALSPLNVFLTFDVEIWCGGWNNIDAKFPTAFLRYVYGRSKQGDFGLPLVLKLLSQYKLQGTFFVEPLFAYKFGIGPLTEIVGLIQEGGQEVQLHLHPEWSDEARPAILQSATSKRQHLFQYSQEEQTILIAKGKSMIEAAGAKNICSFRAGSYACNRATFQALSENGIHIDSSINPSRPWSGSDLPSSERSQRVTAIDGVVEFPITVFQDRPSHMRQIQVGSTSLNEFIHLIPQAYAQKRRAFVIVSHNFEMLVPDRNIPDPTVVKRFTGLCRFLAENRAIYPTKLFTDVTDSISDHEPPLLISPVWRTGLRNLEQLRRRLYR